jgi:hypothetical protein
LRQGCCGYFNRTIKEYNGYCRKGRFPAKVRQVEVIDAPTVGMIRKLHRSWHIPADRPVGEYELSV